MAKLRTVHNEKELAAALKQRADHIEILGALAQHLCGAAVDKAFPLPPVDLDELVRLRDGLRAEKEGPGS